MDPIVCLYQCPTCEMVYESHGTALECFQKGIIRLRIPVGSVFRLNFMSEISEDGTIAQGAYCKGILNGLDVVHFKDISIRDALQGLKLLDPEVETYTHNTIIADRLAARGRRQVALNI